MKRFSHITLTSSSATDLIDQVKTSKYSILKSLNANRLRLEMVPVGIICRFVLWIILLNPAKKYDRACKILDFFFPTTIRQDLYMKNFRRPSATVVYFNHQSLFEVLAIITYCLKNFRSKNFIFPVNLPWYECLAPLANRLSLLGINITPMITPKTNQKLIKAQSPEILHLINKIRDSFNNHYFKLVVQYAKNADVIAVAPSATRESTIFINKAAYHHGNDGDITAKTISMILLALQRALRNNPNLRINFVPAVFTPTKHTGKGLNIWRHHDAYIGKALSFRQMYHLRQQKKADFVARRKLAQYLPPHIWYPQP